MKRTGCEVCRRPFELLSPREAPTLGCPVHGLRRGVEVESVEQWRLDAEADAKTVVELLTRGVGRVLGPLGTTEPLTGYTLNLVGNTGGNVRRALRRGWVRKAAEYAEGGARLAAQAFPGLCR